jgi:hypothetical protein
MPVDPERATAIQNSVARTLRFAAEEVIRSPDRTASMLLQASTQLESSDAKEHLSLETMVMLRAQIADLQKQAEDAARAEMAGRIERDVKRWLSALEDEVRTNGSQIDSFLARAETRLVADDVHEYLTPETIAALRRNVDELRTKAGRSAPAPSAAPERAVHAPASAAEPPAPAATTAGARAGADAPPSQSQESEESKRITGSIARTLRFAAGEIDSPGWRQIGGQLAQAAHQIQSDGAKQHVPPEVLDRLRAQLTELETRFEERDRADRIEEIEEFLGRLLRDAENHVDWTDRIGGMLARVTEGLESEKTRTYLPADRAEFYRQEVARIAALASGTARQRILDDATRPLVELEELVTESVFDGLDEYEAQKRWSDLEVLKDRVGYALDRLAADDESGQELRARLDAVVARRSAAYETMRRTSVLARVSAAWEATLARIAGWEDETQDTGARALGGVFMPKTQEAVRTLRAALSGSSLHSPIPDARQEYAGDSTLAAIVEEGERMINAGLAKMAAAFDAIMDAAEQLPTPTEELEQRAATFMAQTARDAFEGTAHAEPRVERARALLATWESTLEDVRVATEAYYASLANEAANAWPEIASSVEAEDGFDPSDPSWRGRTVRINGLYNRIGWDFGGNYHLAIWVNGIPVAGNFASHVHQAFTTAQRNTRSSIDDHTKWDAILVVEGPGQVRQRFKTTVKKDGETLGEIEEWLPVDCVLCRVIALRAGPVAVGPQ